MSMSTQTRALPGTGIKLGTTLFSMSNEWVEGVYDINSLIARVAEAGIGPGVEIVGFQTIRNFPDVSDDFVRTWQGLLERYDLEPSCLAVNMDVALRRDRMLTEDELTEYLSRQLRAADTLGFPTIRVQMGATPAVIERIVDDAEARDITIGMEIHAPEGPTTPAVLKIREAYAKIGSDRLGFIPDFSSTMRDVPQGEIDYFVKHGLPVELTPDLRRIWREDGPLFERYSRFAELARSRGASEESVQRVTTLFTMHGHEPLESWAEILPQVVHVHGKFYEIDENGQEPSVDIPAIMKLFVDGGYQGYISSEWEGGAFRATGEVDPVVLVRQQHQLMAGAVADAVEQRDQV